VLIILEGAYSMDGNIPDIRKAIDIKRRYDALLMIDEAHSLGL
jgi:7-keto-8-aminopelargonate synthetase and related enzymes